MSVVVENPRAFASRPALRVLHWCGQGFRLWMRVPFKLFLLCLAQMVVEGVLQQIPLVGMTLSKVVVPVLVMGILLGLDALVQGRGLRWSSLLDALRGGRWRAALGLAALWGLGVFAVQQATAWLVYGWPAVDAVWLGHMVAHRELMTMNFQRVLILPGVVPGVLLLLAPCRLLFRGRSPWQAVCDSVRMLLRAPAACLLFLLLNLALLGLAFSTHWAFLLTLVYAPWSVACTYAAWRDLDESVPQS